MFAKNLQDPAGLHSNASKSSRLSRIFRKYRTGPRNAPENRDAINDNRDAVNDKLLQNLYPLPLYIPNPGSSEAFSFCVFKADDEASYGRTANEANNVRADQLPEE